MHSSPAKAATVAVHDEVAAAAAGADRAAAAAEAAAVEEVKATAPKIPVAVQVESRGAAAVEAVKATAAEAEEAVAVASTCLLAAVFAVDRGAIGEKTAPRKRATSYPGVPGAQVLAAKGVPAHRTRRYWWWSCWYPKKTLRWKLRRSW